jgi:NAD(P)-dependent dehydrogenase (short-subunit alcohol dehydrogenase family)
MMYPGISSSLRKFFYWRLNRATHSLPEQLMQDIFSVEGKHILITGASSGLGSHMASMLAGRGARVTAAARRVDRLQALVEGIREKGGEAEAIAMDVVDRDAVVAGFDEACARFGAVDVVINNAGTAARAPAEDTPAEDWHRVIDANLNGAWYVAQCAGRHMIDSGNGGSIINMASIMAYRQSDGLAAYCSSKAAVNHLTHVLALEWAAHGIRVNAIAPGYIYSEMTEATLASERGRAMIANTPLKRAGTPRELDGAVLLLASEASSFINGATIVVDGGHMQTSL